jgi:CheY-like chemotaxis protein
MEKLICVIEDNTPIRKLYCTLLKKSGLITVDFGNAATALEWLSTNKPDCIIVDIQLPDKSGTEILKIIRESKDGDKIPVIAATGFAQSSDQEKFLSLGFDSYLAKPINTSTFSDDIKIIIDKKNTKNII